MSTSLTPSTQTTASEADQSRRQESIAPQQRPVTGALRSIWTVLIWLFLLMVAAEFYLAGHGAFEFHNASAAARDDAWAAHAALGSLMGVVVILSLVVAGLGRLPRRLLILNAALFGFMLVQVNLPAYGDAASTRWIAAFHALNALIVTGLGAALAVLGRQFLRPARGRETTRSAKA